MKVSFSRIDETKLDQALADVRQYITDTKNWQAAMRILSSIRDFSFNDAKACTSQEALDYCEQIKGCFPNTVSQSVITNFDAIASEVRRIEKEDSPILSEIGPTPLVIVIVAAVLPIIVIYWFFFR